MNPLPRRFAFVFVLALCGSALAAPTAAKPNILVILTDDLGYGDLSCYGSTHIRTPQVDKLAAEGLRFTSAYSPPSTCTPSRYALLTGEYAWRQSARKTTILDGDAPLCIEPGRNTLPGLLRRAGYRTGVVGKWHLGLGDGQARVDLNKEIKPGPLEVGYAHIIPATVDRVPCVWIKNHRVAGLDPADPIEASYLKNISDEPTGLEHPEMLKQPADKQHACTIINAYGQETRTFGNCASFRRLEQGKRRYFGRPQWIGTRFPAAAGHRVCFCAW